MEKRVFENPLIKDKVTVLKSADETNGEYLLVQVELAVGGGNNMHYHTTFDEIFVPVEGVLGIDLEKQKLRLSPGEEATAPLGKLHRFYNPGTSPIIFNVKITPASNRFLEGLSIGYGLAADGKTNKNGIPKSFDHLAVLLDHTDTRLTGFLSLIEPFILRRARRATKRGIKQQLIEQYCY